MSYEFPVITNIEQVREAIKGRDEFIEADRGDHTIFNYVVNFAHTFPPVTDETTALLRECRGIVFDKASGEVIGRRYHKFFNLNERAETMLEAVDFTQPHVILEKLDGSMITPFLTSAGRLVIGTKMGDTDVAKYAAEFIESHNNYSEFVGLCVSAKCTPIFEWCSRKNRIVIDHPVDRLVLTAVRGNELGEYMDYDALLEVARLYDIEVVKTFDLSLSEARETLSSIEDEGYVVRFDDGHMLKMKGSHYCQLHKTLEHIQHEKDLIRLIIDEKLDDAKPFLPLDLVQKLDEFGELFFKNVQTYADDLTWNVVTDWDLSRNSKKKFAEMTVGKDETKLRFMLYDYMSSEDSMDLTVGEIMQYARELIIKKISNSLSTGPKVDTVRHLFGGIKW